MIRFALAGCLVLASALPGRAQLDTSLAALEASDRIAAATELLASVDRREDRIEALTEAIHGFEDGLDAMRAGLRDTALREQALIGDLDARREELSHLVAVLATIERTPRPVFLVHPNGPAGVARTGQLMAAATPALQNEAAALQLVLEELQELRDWQEEAEAQTRLALIGLQSARTALADSTARAPVNAAADLDALLRSSENLSQLAEGLAGLSDAAGGPSQALEPPLALPVEGALLRRFGQADASGVPRPGIALAVDPLSLVTLPHAATIRYAGAFLDYGKVVIFEPTTGVLVMLVGLGQLYVQDGEVLAPGRPLGLMGGASPDTEEFLIEARRQTGTLSPETLYIEIRQEGIPVDPADWFDLGRANRNE